MRHETAAAQGPSRRTCSPLLGDSRLASLALSIAHRSALLPGPAAGPAQHKQWRFVARSVGSETSRNCERHQPSQGAEGTAGGGLYRCHPSRRLPERRPAAADAVPGDGPALLRHPSQARSSQQGDERLEGRSEHRARQGTDSASRGRGCATCGRETETLVQKMEATSSFNGLVPPSDRPNYWTVEVTTTPIVGVGKPGSNWPRSRASAGFAPFEQRSLHSAPHSPKTGRLSITASPMRAAEGLTGSLRAENQGGPSRAGEAGWTASRMLPVAGVAFAWRPEAPRTGPYRWPFITPRPARSNPGVSSEEHHPKRDRSENGTVPNAPATGVIDPASPPTQRPQPTFESRAL